jgi:anti-sigma factor RsiW
MDERIDVDVHLATCPECATELARYREVIAAVGALGETLEAAPAGLPDRVVAHVLASESRWTGRARRVVGDRRVHVAAASLGGALVGAGAIALLWRRGGRRPVGVRTA